MSLRPFRTDIPPADVDYLRGRLGTAELAAGLRAFFSPQR